MTEPHPETLESEVPIWPALLAPILRVLSSGEVYHRKDLFDRAADEANLSPTARAETLNSGGLRYEQRMGWVLSHLSKAKWVDRPSKGYYAINGEGRDWFAKNPNGLDYTKAREVFAPFWPKRTKPAVSREQPAGTAETLDDLDPIEQIEEGIDRVHSDVGEELLNRLRESHPDFFEQAVVDLLLKMGYGGAEQRGRKIGGSGDGGVDGVIDQDALGLEQIYVQAKRYKDGNNAGRETIQAFVGALQGVGASRGVFITTSGFTPNAKQYAATVSSRIILIDARRLVSLMIKYRVGIQARETYTVVEIDEDFFE